MFEIKADELRILNRLVHAEDVESVIADTGIPAKVVIDIVRHLFHFRYIKAVNDDGRELGMFEIDGIRKVKFMLTSKGFLEIERQLKGTKNN
jgi:hypothetical protein